MLRLLWVICCGRVGVDEPWTDGEEERGVGGGGEHERPRNTEESGENADWVRTPEVLMGLIMS